MIRRADCGGGGPRGEGVRGGRARARPPGIGRGSIRARGRGVTVAATRARGEIGFVARGDYVTFIARGWDAMRASRAVDEAAMGDGRWHKP